MLMDLETKAFLLWQLRSPLWQESAVSAASEVWPGTARLHWPHLSWRVRLFPGPCSAHPLMWVGPDL